MLRHVSESGEELFSVRVASSRLVSSEFIREISDIADRYCDGFLRFTTRNNVEFLVSDKAKLQPLLAELDEKDYMVGGVGMVIAVFLCSVIGYLLVSKMIKPVEKLTDYLTDKISNMDFTVDEEQEKLAGHKDEIGSMSKAVSRLREKLGKSSKF